MPTVFVSVFIIAIIVAMVWDVLTLEIPDTISVVLVVAFFTGAFLADVGMRVSLLHLSAAFAVFVVGFILFALKVWGGGDVKLAAAIALWLGFENMFSWLILVAIAGGVLAVSVLLFRKVKSNDRWPAWVHRLHQPNEGIPYGVALGIGALACVKSVGVFFQAGHV